MASEREKDRYSRDPIATTHEVDWWRVGGARFLRRMGPADRQEWDRFAHRLTVPAKQRVELPRSLGPMYAVVVSGRVRIAIPEPEPERAAPNERRPDAPPPRAPHEPEAAKTGVTWAKPQPSRPDPSAQPPPAPAPRHPIVYVAEAGDLFGTFGGRASEAVKRPLDVEALRDTEIQFATSAAFRGYLWRRPAWSLPAPVADAVSGPSLRARAGRILASAVDAMRRLLGPPGVPLADLCGRSRNSRAACALLAFLGAGHTLAGPELRIRRRLWPGQLARRIGTDPEWVKMWIGYAESEKVIRYARGRWTILQQWRLHGWADAVSTEQSFALPPDPFDEPTEQEETLGRASRNPDGTTPVPDTPAAAAPY